MHKGATGGCNARRRRRTRGNGAAVNACKYRKLAYSLWAVGVVGVGVFFGQGAAVE